MCCALIPYIILRYRYIQNVFVRRKLCKRKLKLIFNNGMFGFDFEANGTYTTFNTVNAEYYLNIFCNANITQIKWTNIVQ